MRISHTWLAHSIQFTIHCELEETPAHVHTPRYFTKLLNDYTSGQPTFRFLLPDAISDFEAVHPDLWALVVILAVYPFLTTSLQLSWSVSAGLAEAFHQATGGKTLSPVDTSIKPRLGGDVDENGEKRSIGVAYNGRLHAFMTAAVVGQDAKLVAIDHWNARQGTRTSPYPADGLYYALDVMEKKQYHVSMVKSDIESLCEPFGFPHPLTPACAPVLLADALQLHTVALGSRLYDLRAFQHPRQPLSMIGFKHVDIPVQADANEMPHIGSIHGWRQLFAACGLLLEFPTCGAHDVLLIQLMQQHGLWDEAHYCLYARPQYRCQQCVECLYYSELYKALTKAPTTFDALWNRCSNHYPETVACLHDVQVPNRWLTFWPSFVQRPDMLPKGKQFVHLLRLRQLLNENAHNFHAGLKTMTSATLWPRIEQGLQRLLMVLYLPSR